MKDSIKRFKVDEEHEVRLCAVYCATLTKENVRFEIEEDETFIRVEIVGY